MRETGGKGGAGERLYVGVVGRRVGAVGGGRSVEEAGRGVQGHGKDRVVWIVWGNSGIKCKRKMIYVFFAW